MRGGKFPPDGMRRQLSGSESDPDGDAPHGWRRVPTLGRWGESPLRYPNLGGRTANFRGTLCLYRELRGTAQTCGQRVRRCVSDCETDGWASLSDSDRHPYTPSLKVGLRQSSDMLNSTCIQVYPIFRNIASTKCIICQVVSEQESCTHPPLVGGASHPAPKCS
jgi:hypothetical protein